MPDKPATAKPKAKAAKPKAVTAPAPTKDVVAKLIELHPEIEAALASGSYPDLILNGLSASSRGIGILASAIKQNDILNGGK